MLKLKHEIVTLKQLSREQGPFYVYIFDPVVPKATLKWVSTGGFTLPQKLCLISIKEYYNEAYQICYLDFEKQYNFYKSVPMDLKVAKLLGKTTINKMKKQLELLKLNNFHNELIHTQGFPASNNSRMYVGSDPEVFVEDDKGNIIPAFNFLGSKTDGKTKSVGSDREYSVERKVYWDGFQAEFETTADFCLSYHVDSIRNGLKAVLKYAREHNPSAKLSIKTCVEIPTELLMESKEEYIQLGCMPSYNAYKMTGEPISEGRQLPIRSTGGHIHFGVGKLTEKEAIPIVKALDKIIGVACVSLFANYDNPARRRYYGLAGEYRLPPHGLEYRVLSNAWLVHPVITNIVFDIARKAYMMGKNGFMEVWKATEEETIECINKCDVVKSREILERNKVVFKKLIKAAYGIEGQQNDALFNTFMNGMESIIANPEDIEKNWNLHNDVWSGHNETQGKRVGRALEILTQGEKVA